MDISRLLLGEDDTAAWDWEAVFFCDAPCPFYTK